MKCIEEVKKKGNPCENTNCRYFIEHVEDQNCTIICADNNGKMSLNDIGKILGTSSANIFAIQTKAIKKLMKKMKKNDYRE